MRDSWQEKFKLFLLHRIPLLTTFLLMFVFFMPVSSVQLNYFRPMIGVICVYYWSLKRNYMFSYISAFCVGFLADIYSSSPLGLNIFFMMLLVYVTYWIGRYFQSASFGQGWFIFGLVDLGYIFIKWLFLVAYFGRLLPFGTVLLGYFSTLLFYPMIVSLNVWVQNHLLPQERINE